MFEILTSHVAIFFIIIGLIFGSAAFYMRFPIFLSAASLSSFALAGFINYSIIDAKLSLPQFVLSILIFTFFAILLLTQQKIIRRITKNDFSTGMIGTKAVVIYNNITPSQTGTVRVSNRICKARLEPHISTNIDVGGEVKITGLEGNICLITPVTPTIST
jgi:membrane protein implicated in regulation of membrane protease activity